MNQREIKELIELLVEKDIAEFALERGDMKLHIKRGAPTNAAASGQIASGIAPVHVISMPSAPPATVLATPASSGPGSGAAAPPVSATAEAPEEADVFVVKSPIVGTFYEAPSPGTPPFVKIGDTVKEGQVLCIIEAMKLMNEIEAEVSGVIAKAYIANGNPVEYGMPLFGIRRQ